MNASERGARLFTLSAFGYFLDFALVPPLVALMLGAKPVAVVLWLLLGVAAWSLAEYVIHRWLFHALPGLAPLHELHHAHPKAWVGLASWGTLPGFASVFALLWLVTGTLPALPAIAGFMSGYLVYCTIHIRLHHARRLWRYERFMRELHVAHHRGGRGNFGVTSPLWDMVFLTYRPAATP